jgi:hypothetical protein
VKNPFGTSPEEVIEYKTNDFSILMPLTHNGGDCSPISVGPPVVPIIPLFCFASESYTYFNFIIESIDTPLTVDIQKITLKTAGKIGSSPAQSFSCNVREKYDSFGCYNIRDRANVISGTPVTINGRVSFMVQWLHAESPDERIIHLRGISVNGKEIDIPSLSLRKNTNLLYCPLMLSGHEPCFR